MNKMHKSKRLKWGSLITICCLIGVALLSVNAKSLSKLPKAKVKKVANKSCDNIDYGKTTYATDIDPTNDGRNINIKASAKGDFYLVIASTDGDEELSYQVEEINNGKGNKKKPDIDFSYRFNNDRYYASIVLVLKTGDGVCKGVTEEKAREIARQIFEDGETTEKNFFATWKNLSIEYDDKQVENTTYNGICKDFRNKEYNNKFQDFQDLYQQYQVQGKVTNFDYCNHQFVDYNYSEDDVVLMIENALIGTYGATTDTESSSGENFEVTEEDVRPDNDKDISDGYKLQCSPNNVYNSKDTDYYVNKRTYFYQKETKVNNKCTQTCKEKVTVEYGPPVATKAGMCFEYKVKVKSKVNCKTKFTGTPPNSSDYKLCNVYPYCNNGDHYYQAGPEEEFDNCISKCDKGKYTQSCINKCYKKVYEDSNTLDVNYNTKNIAQNNLPSLDINCNSLTSDAERISDYVKTKEYKEKYFYKLENGKIIWTGRGNQSSWIGLGVWYLTPQRINATIRSVSSLGRTGANAISGCGEKRGSKYFRYKIDWNGFKRACMDYSCSSSCTETCEWKTNCTIKNGKLEANHYLNEQDRSKALKDALDNYKREKNECKALASCSEKTTSFTITVDNKKLSGSNKIEFSQDITKNKPSSVTVNNKSYSELNLFLDRGGCYGDTRTENQFMAEWSFPGVWKNNKNGELNYGPQDEKTWTFKKGKFCTSLESSNINEKWFDWSQKNSDIPYVPNLTTTGDVDKLDYEKNDIIANIFATVRNFGHFNWNFDMSCFYAINDGGTPPPCDPTKEKCDESCDPTKEKCDGLISYRIRSIDKTNLFPDESRRPSGEKDKIIGVNWTNQLAVIGNNYEITPTALIQHIQDNKDYSEDYSFSLTIETMKKIKQYYKDQEKYGYSKFNGTIREKGEDKNPVKTYRSDFIRDNSIFTDKKINRKLGCNNSKDISHCKTIEDDTLTALIRQAQNAGGGE